MIKKIIFAFSDTLLTGLLLLFFSAFFLGGFRISLFDVTLISIHDLNLLFWIILILTFCHFNFHPRMADIRHFSRSASFYLYLILVVLGGSSVGIFLFYKQHPDLFLSFLFYDKDSIPSLLIQYIEAFTITWLYVWIFISTFGSHLKTSQNAWKIYAITLSLGILFLLFLPAEVFHWDMEYVFLFNVVLIAFMAGSIISQSSPLKLDKVSPYLTVILIGAFVILFSVLSVCKLLIFRADIDYPIYLQAWWNTLHGKFMWVNWSLTDPGEGMNRFGEHWMPIKLLLFPLYVIFPSPHFFVVLQVVFVAIASIPLYKIVLMKSESKWFAFSIVWVYLTSLFVQRPLLFDIHTAAFEPLFIFMAFLSLLKRKHFSFILWCTLLMMCKEDAALYVVLFGSYAIFFQRNVKAGLGTIAYGLAWLVISVQFIVPFFNEGDSYFIIGKRYALGDDLGSLLFTIFFHPGKVILHLSDVHILKTLLYLLIPLAALPLFSFSGALLFLLPSLKMFLGSFWSMRYFQFQYALFVIPFYFLGAAESIPYLIKRLQNHQKILINGLGGFMICTSTLFMLYLDPNPKSRQSDFNRYYLNRSPLNIHFDRELYRMGEHDRIGHQWIKEKVPDEVSLCVDYRFAPFLSNREVLRPFPKCDDTEYIFADWKGIPGRISITRQKQHIKNKLKYYGVIAYQDGYVLLKRGASPEQNDDLIREIEGHHEAERLPKISGVGINSILDGKADNKFARYADPSISKEGVLTFGPYINAPKGTYLANFRVRTDINYRSGEAIATLSVKAKQNQEVLATKTLFVSDFPESNDYRSFELEFINPNINELEFVVDYHNIAPLWIDSIHLRSLE